MWERACSRKTQLGQSDQTHQATPANFAFTGARIPPYYPGTPVAGPALLPTLSANGNTRYEYVITTTPKVARLCRTRPLQAGPRMNRIVNLPMALRRSKLRHSARPPDIAC